MPEGSSHRVRALFDEAADLPPESRAAFLEVTCQNEPELRARVEYLLACDARLGAKDTTGSLLASPVVRAVADTGPAPEGVQALDEPPARLGRYVVEEEIGRGGMGCVLRGHDPELGRDLAIKVLLDAHRHEPAQVSRFTEEAQIGGQLQHPGIVPVYDVGRAGQRPYFTMKLVRGHTLAELLRERTAPHEGLPRFLQVFEQVCQTIAYAHSRGVIHRDLKPSNVMVGAFGEVQVMDWGIAKVLVRASADPLRTDPQPLRAAPEALRTHRSTGQGPVSRTGSVLGTPAYMAPEQARGAGEDVDERCDVFGLGAILCEILTSEPPYRGAHDLEILDRAVRADLAEAHARLENCGADADLIRLARASLAADPAQRPRDAGVLARELAAHRESMERRLRQAELAEVEARSRAAEERKRRRLTVGLALSVLATALVASGGWVWITRSREETERRTRELRTEQTRDAEAAYTRAVNLRQEARAGGHSGKWAEARAQARRAEALLERWPDQDELGGRVGALLSELDDEATDHQLLVRLDEIALLRAGMRAGEKVFDDAPALAEYETALRGYGVAFGTPAARAAARIRQRPGAVRERVVAALEDWLVLLVKYHRTEEARWLTGVLAGADSDPWRQKLRVARTRRERTELEQLAGDPHLLDQPPQSLLMLSAALYVRGARQEAQGVLRRARERYPNDYWISHELGMWDLQQSDRPVEAVRFFMVCTALRPESPGPYINLGSALVRVGELEEGIAAYRRALTLTPETALAHANLGHALFQKGDTAGAIAAWRRALELSPDDPGYYNDLGAALVRRGDLDGAVASFRKAVALKPDYELPATNLGAILHRQGKFREAVTVYREFLKSAPNAPGRGAIGASIRETQRLIELDRKLDDYLTGALKPAGPAQEIDLADLCRVRQLYAAATGFYARAFALPGLAPDPETGYRFQAACCAVQAADGRGADAAELNESARAGLRRQALGWLEAEYEALAARYDAARWADKNRRGGALRDWQIEPRLAGVRDRAALERVPAPERARWLRLWADVETLASLQRPAPLERGRAHAARGQWAKAVRCYQLALELDATADGHFWFEYAALLLLSNERREYTRVCARLVERGLTPGVRAYHVARTCTLAPDAGKDVVRAGWLADEELNGSADFWALTQRAALLVRTGHSDRAVHLLVQSLKAEEKPGVSVVNWLWLALANQKLERTEDARQWLDRARRWLGEYADGMPANAERDLGLDLHRWLEAQVLLREVEGLRAGTDKPAGQPGKR
jgi:serine/threonine-protein kinase